MERWLAGDSTTWGLLFEPRDSGVVVEFQQLRKRTSRTLPESPAEAGGEERPGIRARRAGHDTTITRPGHARCLHRAEYKARWIRHGSYHQGLDGRAALYFPMREVSQNYSRAVERAELHLFADTLDPLEIRYPDQNGAVCHRRIERRDQWQAAAGLADEEHSWGRVRRLQPMEFDHDRIHL